MSHFCRDEDEATLLYRRPRNFVQEPARPLWQANGGQANKSPERHEFGDFSGFAACGEFFWSDLVGSSRIYPDLVGPDRTRSAFGNASTPCVAGLIYPDSL
ncbi:hypothetical protein SBV1_1330036 [Verrucomicrobia bacterium]|nr:hypothetical protein SBV1_1330036 [Verrucomicrobiota bacterium]